MPTVAVIGHFEWVTHTRGEVPVPGQIVHLHESVEGPGTSPRVWVTHSK